MNKNSAAGFVPVIVCTDTVVVEVQLCVELNPHTGTKVWPHSLLSILQQRIECQAFLSRPPCRDRVHRATAECWNSWKVMGKLFTVYYLTPLRLIHPCSHRSEGSLSTFPHAAHSWPFGCDLLPRRLQQFVPSSLFLHLVFPGVPFPIPICFMVFLCVLFVSL